MPVDVAELELPEIDFLRSDFACEPFGPIAAARAQNWLAKCNVGYMVLDFQGMKELFGRDDVLRTSNTEVTAFMQAEGTPWGEWNTRFLLAKSGRDHARLRSLVAGTFTPRNAAAHRPLMRQVVTDLTVAWAERGRFDFTDFASFFPITVMCGLIGAPQDRVPFIKDWLETIGGGFSLDRTILPALNEAYLALHDFVDGLLAGRSDTGDVPQDLIDMLIAAKLDGEHLTKVELNDLVVLLLGGGYDTSKNLLGMIVYALLDRAEDWRRLADDTEFVRRVIDETMRLYNIINTYRLTNDELVYREVRFPKDTMLVFPLSAAGRDPAVFADATRFDADRKPEQSHIGFGRGAHICLGQFIARAQIEEALPIMARHLRNIRLEGEVAWRPFPGIWGLKALPVAFDPL